MLSRIIFAAFSLAVFFWGFTLTLEAQAFDMSSFNENLKKINESGFVLLAEQGGQIQVVGNATQFKAMISDDKAPVFYLLYKKTGKKYRVKETSDGKKDPGEYISEFYMWLVDPVSEKK